MLRVADHARLLALVLPDDVRGGRSCAGASYALPMVRIGTIVLKVSDTRRAAAFWSQALGYQPAANPDFLVPEETDAPRLHLDEEDRTHLDLWAADEEEQLAEVERLLTLGAARVDWDYPEGADFVVLADPDGNLFCVINSSA